MKRPSSKITKAEHILLRSLVECLHSALSAVISITKHSPRFNTLAIDIDIEVERLRSELESVATHNYGKGGAAIYDQGDSGIPF